MLSVIYTFKLTKVFFNADYSNDHIRYILHVFRIPYGLKSPQTNQTRPPVLLMHGLMDSSNGYINLGPENSLGKSKFCR